MPVTSRDLITLATFPIGHFLIGSLNAPLRGTLANLGLRYEIDLVKQQGGGSEMHTCQPYQVFPVYYRKTRVTTGIPGIFFWSKKLPELALNHAHVGAIC